MDKAIVTVLLIICGITASLAVFNGLYPAITQSSSAVTSASSRLSNRIESRIEIIQANANSTNITQAHAWVKNVGTVSIKDISGSDVFFGTENDFYRVTFGGTTPPYWGYQIEGGNTEWSQTVTVKITITLSSSLSSGTYMVKMVIPNGIYHATTFGVP